ncbi:MAG TPA: AraC family transcriptional regulator [Vicinamibacteria bacterium]
MSVPRPASFRSVRGPLLLERRPVPGGPGLVALEQRLACHGSATRLLVTGEGWLLAAVEVERGRLDAAGGATPARFTLFVPPRSVVSLRLEAAALWSLGVGGLGDPPAAHAVPVLLRAQEPRPVTAEDVLHLAGAETVRTLEADPPGGGRRAPLADARRRLHENRAGPRPLAASAAELGLSPPALCKAFCAAYGITPKQYVQRARVFDAVLMLLLGRPVMEAALEAGFADLSRFYRQFGRLVGSTPARYRRASARTAKTAAPRVR